MVMDNLEVKPMSAISSITLLTKFNVRDLGAVEEKVVYFGVDELYIAVITTIYQKHYNHISKYRSDAFLLTVVFYFC
jgi:hypothetical protein